MLRLMVLPTLLVLLAISQLGFSNLAWSADHFLTIGGGYSRDSNQASLEKNVLLFQRTLRRLELDKQASDIYFSAGNGAGADVQVIDPESLPKANRLMAEFFGSDDDLGLLYRDHRIPNVRGAATPSNLRKWFDTVGSTMTAGDRLFLYVTAHGHGSRNRNDKYETTIATWDNSAIKMSELVKILDGLPAGVDVVTIMVQCYAGGFSHFIFNEGDPDQGLATGSRVGFFATVHNRQAAGCTADVDESSYVEYSTYFWAALTGIDRSGKPIPLPDYNGDGLVSLVEAHAYTILTANTVDLPIKTSGEFLNLFSKYGKSKKKDNDKESDDESNLLTEKTPYQTVLALATPSEKAILEGLSEQLELTGSNRIADAQQGARPRRNRGRGRGRRGRNSPRRLRRTIANDLKQRWPQLVNPLNPVSVSLLTDRSDEFVEAIEQHADYARYRELFDSPRPNPNDPKRLVKYERFLRAAENVILAENLRRLGDVERIAQYESLVKSESQTMQPAN